MIRRSISLEEDLWFKAKEKAGKGGVSLSGIIRVLLKMWINGEIEIKLRFQ
jgi:hypothetical protein